MASSICKMFDFRLIFAILMLNFVFNSSAQEIDESNLRTIMENFIKVQEMFDSLSKKVEQLEESSSSSLRAINNTQTIKSAIEDLTKKIEVIGDNSKVFKNCNMCESDPCICGGQCVPILCGKDFRCIKCPGYRSGVHCENVHFNCVLNVNCWEHNNTLYRLLGPKVGWTEAMRKCESEGMRLIMPKEKEQTEFIVNQLRFIYGSGGGNWFWMGIAKSAGKWKWIDGNNLGSYTGGYSIFKSADDDRYGHLWLSNGDSMWHWDDIDDLHYPLCERRGF